MKADVVIRQTRCWVERVVIDLGLCPFVRRVLEQEQLRITVCEGRNEETLLHALADELALLDRTPATEIDTTLLVHPHVLTDFTDYNDFTGLIETLLYDSGYEGIYQIAGFHPAYLFAGSNENDPANYTNRSPWPMLHLLREDSVARAIDGFPDIEQVPQRNIERLRRLGLKRVRDLLQDCRD